MLASRSATFLTRSSEAAFPFSFTFWAAVSSFSVAFLAKASSGHLVLDTVAINVVSRRRMQGNPINDFFGSTYNRFRCSKFQKSL